MCFFHLILFFNPLLFFLTFIIICFCFPFPVTFSVFFPPKFFQKEKFVELQDMCFSLFFFSCNFLYKIFPPICDKNCFHSFLHLSLRMMVYSLPFNTPCFFYSSSFWDTCVLLFYSAFRLVKIVFFVILRPLQKTIFN